MWLLDTNAIIKLPKQIRDKFTQEQIKCSYITTLEHPIAHKYTNMEIIFPDEAIWTLCLKMAIRLRNLGKIIPIPDLIIGSTAITYNLTLVSDNHHFQPMQKINLGLTTISHQQFEDLFKNL